MHLQQVSKKNNYLWKGNCRKLFSMFIQQLKQLLLFQLILSTDQRNTAAKISEVKAA